jgi:hypothetical protein
MCKQLNTHPSVVKRADVFYGASIKNKAAALHEWRLCVSGRFRYSSNNMEKSKNFH